MKSISHFDNFKRRLERSHHRDKSLELYIVARVVPRRCFDQRRYNSVLRIADHVRADIGEERSFDIEEVGKEPFRRLRCQNNLPQ